MPELPEVETIRRQLEENLVGAEIIGVEVRRESCYGGSLIGKRELVENVVRVGKYLFIAFASGRGFAIHLKMTGRIVINVEWYERAPHTRVIILLADGRKVYYWDARTFGYVRLEENILEKLEEQRKKLGPDPWEMTEEQFYKICQKYSRPIKNLILDQTIIAGVGNIYANDGLWEAGVDPQRESRSMKHESCSKLLLSLRRVMERGLVTGGASDNSYVDALGNKGRYQEEFRVYRRTNEPCLRCGNKLKRVVVGGRGSWVCEECQY